MATRLRPVERLRNDILDPPLDALAPAAEGDAAALVDAQFSYAVPPRDDRPPRRYVLVRSTDRTLPVFDAS